MQGQLDVTPHGPEYYASVGQATPRINPYDGEGQNQRPQLDQSNSAPYQDFNANPVHQPLPPKADPYREERKLTLKNYNRGPKFHNSAQHPDALVSRYNKFEVEVSKK